MLRLLLALYSALAVTSVPAEPNPALSKHLRAINTTHLVAALRLASECRGAALRDAAAGSTAAAAAAATDGARAAGSVNPVISTRLQQLALLLPDLDDHLSDAQQLQGRGGLLTALQAAVEDELGARLAAARRPSRLARALSLTNIAVRWLKSARNGPAAALGDCLRTRHALKRPFPTQQWFVGCLLIVVALLALVGIYLAAIVIAIPLPVWEAAAYAAAAALLRQAVTASPAATAPFVALTGLLLLSATVCASASLHLRRYFWESEAAVTAYCALNAAAYAAVAARLQVGCRHWASQTLPVRAGSPTVRLAPGPCRCAMSTLPHSPTAPSHQASMLGTLTVWWGVSALGFFIACLPFVTTVGFRGGLWRPYLACLAAVLAFAPFKARRGRGGWGRQVVVHMLAC